MRSTSLATLGLGLAGADPDDAGASLGRAQKGLTMQDVLMRAVKDRIGVPFERVRLVNRDEDVITPELPPLPVVKEEKEGRVKAKLPGQGKDKSQGKKAKKAKEADAGVADTGTGADPVVYPDEQGLSGTPGAGVGKGMGKGKGKGKGAGSKKAKNGKGTQSPPIGEINSNEIPIDPVLLAQGEASFANGESINRSRIMLRIPRPPAFADTGSNTVAPIRSPRLKREKQVDSDGDTIAGSTDGEADELDGIRDGDEGGEVDDTSDLTSLPDRSGDEEDDYDAHGHMTSSRTGGIFGSRSHLWKPFPPPCFG